MKACRVCDVCWSLLGAMRTESSCPSIWALVENKSDVHMVTTMTWGRTTRVNMHEHESKINGENVKNRVSNFKARVSGIGKIYKDRVNE